LYYRKSERLWGVNQMATVFEAIRWAWGHWYVLVPVAVAAVALALKVR
jgi:hypothetical protein